jgi:hypothetical protein
MRLEYHRLILIFYSTIHYIASQIILSRRVHVSHTWRSLVDLKVLWQDSLALHAVLVVKPTCCLESFLEMLLLVQIA